MWPVGRGEINEIMIEVYYVALVKKPHIELSIHGEHIDELLARIKKKLA